MKIFLLFLVLISTLPCMAQRTILGLKLGETRVSQAKDILKSQGISVTTGIDEDELQQNVLLYAAQPVDFGGFSWPEVSFLFTNGFIREILFAYQSEIESVIKQRYDILEEVLLNKYGSSISDYKQSNNHYKLMVQDDRVFITVEAWTTNTPLGNGGFMEPPTVQLKYDYYGDPIINKEGYDEL
jgi:hypothetical protein